MLITDKGTINITPLCLFLKAAAGFGKGEWVETCCSLDSWSFTTWAMSEVVPWGSYTVDQIVEVLICRCVVNWSRHLSILPFPQLFRRQQDQTKDKDVTVLPIFRMDMTLLHWSAPCSALLRRSPCLQGSNCRAQQHISISKGYLVEAAVVHSCLSVLLLEIKN